MSAVPVLRRAPHWFGGYTRHTCLHGVCLVSSRSITPTVPGRPERLGNRPFFLAVLGASGLPGTVGKMVKWEGIIGMKFAILQEGLLGFMPKL